MFLLTVLLLLYLEVTNQSLTLFVTILNVSTKKKQYKFHFSCFEHPQEKKITKHTHTHTQKRKTETKNKNIKQF